MGMGEAANAELEIWYGSMLAAKDYKTKKALDSWIKARAQRMEEGEIGALKSAGSGTSVQENATKLMDAEVHLANGASIEVTAAMIPPSCETMFGKQKCSDYCSVARNCFEMRGLDIRTVGKPMVRLPMAASESV
jgi:hypothetical protein